MATLIMTCGHALWETQDRKEKHLFNYENPLGLAVAPKDTHDLSLSFIQEYFIII